MATDFRGFDLFSMLNNGVISTGEAYSRRISVLSAIFVIIMNSVDGRSMNTRVSISHQTCLNGLK